MEQTCRSCQGTSDVYKETHKLLRCSRCQNTYYCSAACQKLDWPTHKIDCKPARTTAERLVDAVSEDRFPEHPQTCEDYGFNRAATLEDKTNLLGLYAALIKYRGVSPETIHDWRLRGVLVDKIKATFDGSESEHPLGAYFPWFLENQHMIASAGQPLSAKGLRDRAEPGRDGSGLPEEARASPPGEPAHYYPTDGVGPSVWDLKRFVLGAGDLIPSVLVDYGFINCRQATETQKLKEVYKEFFVNHRGHPMALHDAAIKGNLYGYLSTIVPSARGAEFQRLMKNPYPLLEEEPDYDF